jgi:riboflavin synthase alpha subunit
MFRYNTTLGNMEIYTGSQWNSGSDVTVITADAFNGDGSDTTFTLSSNGTTSTTLVMLNGVVQIPTTAYAVSGTTLTFTEAPATGDVIDARVITTTSTITSMQDADADTSINVEVTTDADEIQFTAAGTAIAKVTSAGIIPNVNSNGSTGFDLGASNAQWRDLYVSEGSLYVNGKEVLSDESGTIIMGTDAN